MKRIHNLLILLLTIIFTLIIFPVAASASGWDSLLSWYSLGGGNGQTNEGGYDAADLGLLINGQQTPNGVNGDAYFGAPADAGDTVPSYSGDAYSDKDTGDPDAAADAQEENAAKEDDNNRDKADAKDNGLIEQTITAAQPQQADSILSFKEKRASRLDRRSFREPVKNELPDVTITVRGRLPQGATAKARYFSPAKDEQFEGTVLFAYEITVYDADGAVLENDAELTLTVTSPLIRTALQDGKTVVVRRYTGRDAETEELEGEAAGSACRFQTSDLPARLVFTAENIVSDDPTSTGDATVTVAGFADAYIEASIVGLDSASSAVWQESDGLSLNDGLELIEAYEVSCDGDAGLWLDVKLTGEPELGDLESLALYGLVDGDLGDLASSSDLAVGESAAISLDTADGFALVKDTGLRDRSLTLTPDDGTVTISGRMPTEATASAVPADEDLTEDTVCAYDITLFNNGEEYQPGAANPLTVTIRNDAIADAAADGHGLTLWHIADDGDREEITDFEISGDAIIFEATSFSIYEIIESEAPPTVNTLADLAALCSQPEGFYLSYFSNGTTLKYFTNELNGNNAFVETSNLNNASVWYFEPVEGADDRYYIYTMIDGAKRYMKQIGSGNTMELSAAPSTAFDISPGESNKFYFKVAGKEKYLQHSGSGNGIRLWGDNQNANNSLITISYVPSLTPPNDYYELDGKTYGIVFHEESVKAAGMTSEAKIQSGHDGLAASILIVKPDVLDHSGDLLMAEGSDLTDWEFHLVEGNYYYITTAFGDTPMYLTLNGRDLVLQDTPSQNSIIKVDAGTGENAGTYRLSVGSYAVALSGGKVANGFVSSNNGGDHYIWLQLVKKTPLLNDDDFIVYSADKVDISDRETVPDGSIVVVYTRIWNEERKRYEFYLIDSDGTLVRCYESGGMIQWVGSTVNTELWDFTEYTYSNGDPNFYYELQNTYSGQYIAPQVANGQILSGHTIGVNLNGRRFGYFYSTILAWDDDYYSYVGLKAKNGRIVSCPMDEADDFYFAILRPTPSDEQQEEEMTTVATVDNKQFGITMRIKDFLDQDEMKNYLGNENKWDQKYTPPTQGILSTDLGADGYPAITSASATVSSLGQMFAGATEVNHLFIENTYYSSGYFEYDSIQNFATLLKKKDDGSYEVGTDFTVYDQLGTARVPFARDSLQHSQFLPFNVMEEGFDPNSLNPYNLYDANRNELPDSDPRKGEKLHLTEGPTNYQFGVEIEATFTQTPNGLDDWGHDIIYEFTGDDDFWLYVDGELVIDLGGIHSALAGSVNFSTGDVYFSGQEKDIMVHTNLRTLFYNNYVGRGHTEEQAQAYVDELFKAGTNIFKDNTSHTMRIFYMERGAGASNLHMRFNLASVKPGTVLLSKELTGVDNTESTMAEFPYQIFYKIREEDPWVLLDPAEPQSSVVYQDTNRGVTYHETFAIGGVPYDKVFMLRPGETAEIDFPDDAVYYRIIECGVDTDVFDRVTAAGETMAYAPNGRQDFSISQGYINVRNSVTFENHVRPDAVQTLTFTKRLFNEDGSEEIHNDATVFSFRLYLGTENDESIPLANMYKYHVKDKNGNYCRWDAASQTFMSLGKTDYSQLTEAEKRDATFNTSMNGSISRIPVDYTVEVRELLIGTQYKVEERPGEVPDGYSLQRYDLEPYAGATAVITSDPAQGVIVTGQDPHVDVRNLKGWGLRVNKVWSDAAFIEHRDPVYFAVYTDDGHGNLTLEPGTVRQLTQDQTTLYWYLPSLHHLDFGQFVVREVNVTDPIVDEDGKVTGYTAIAPIPVTGTDNTVSVEGNIYGQDPTLLVYNVAYEKGLVPQGANVRVDTMTNSRPGIDLFKTDWEGEPLAGAVFTLSDGDDPDRTYTFTSDADGRIGTAYLRPNENYTLTEVKSPAGYRAMTQPLTIRRDAYDNVIVSDGEDGYYTTAGATATAIGSITIKNKPCTVQLKKTDPTGTPLAGVHFALYRQVMGENNQPRKDYQPISGYDDLITDSEGLVPLVTAAFQSGSLAPGTYYLFEREPREGYRPLGSDVQFTLESTGVVTVDPSSPSGVNVVISGENTDQLLYTVAIPNELAGTRNLTVQKVVENGTSADAGRPFNFTARVYMPDGQTPWNYNQGGFENGVYGFTVSDAAPKVLTVPLGAVVTVEEQTNIAYDTTFTGGEAINDHQGRVTMDEDHTMVFTNTRKTVEVNVIKVVEGSSDDFEFTVLLQDANGDGGLVNCTGYRLGTTTSAPTADLITDGQGQATFTLTPPNTGNKRASQKLTVPYGSTLTVTETTDSSYSTKVKLNSDPEQDSNSLTLTTAQTKSNSTITVTNTQFIISPTGLNDISRAFLCLSLLGLALLAGAAITARKRRKSAAERR